MTATVPDLLRLVAVPALGWAAYRDVKIRRVPNRLWVALAALGVVLLAWDAWRVGLFQGPRTIGERLFLFRVALSLGVVVPLAYLAWRLGGFGGADAKAVMALAVLFPEAPFYAVGGTVLPLEPGLGVFGMTILTNTVLLGAAYPVALAVGNLAAGEFSVLALVGRRVECGTVTERHGRLLETPRGATRAGLDLDALRMYLRWRGATLADLREDPAGHRDPASLPAEPNPPTDGAIADGGSPPGDPSGDGSTEVETPDAEAAGAVERTRADHDDPWGAEAFLADVPHAWGTSPDRLREGLEVLTGRERVWYSPGIPFVVPMFAGLVVALTYGDLLVALMGAAGLV